MRPELYGDGLQVSKSENPGEYRCMSTNTINAEEKKHRKNVMKLIIFCITVGISLMFIYYQNLRKKDARWAEMAETVLAGEKVDS